jgi:YidC/Oxa1 family membrane protein insertase
MMLFMPLIFTVTFLTLPSGLVLYWLTNNVLGIAQQWLVNRHMARIEPAPQRA